MQVSKGFTFLELLIALTIFSMGLLGVLQLQIHAQLQLQQSIYLSRAAVQAYNLPTLWHIFETTAHESLGTQLHTQWNEKNAALLPQGKGIVSHEKITVTFDAGQHYVELYSNQQ